MDAKKLASALFSVVAAEKQAGSALTSQPELDANNSKLQEIIGDPDTHPTSWTSQFHPSQGDFLMPNSLSPLKGDEVFFSGMFEGGRFQAHDGSYWNILSYDNEASVTIENVYYPRMTGVVSIQDIRKSIHSWTEPLLQRVPPLPSGVDYGVVLTRDADK